MKEYYLTALVTISIDTKVEAKDLEEAKNIAIKRHIEMSNWSDELQNKDCWVVDDFDGEPYNIEEIND